MRELISQELKKEDITQVGLAQKIGISQATIHKILYTETKHTTDILHKVANYFKVPLSSFLDDTMMVCEPHSPYGGDPIKTGRLRTACILKDGTNT